MEKNDRSKIKIFVANDNVSVQMLIKSLLEEDGWTDVETFNNGGELLERIETARPGLIISDIHMPVVDGFEMLREIHSRPEPAMNALPVILYSATFNDFETRRLARELGACAFFSAPLDQKHLAETVARVLGFETGRAAGDESMPPAAIKLLILEDDIFVSKMFNHALKDLGYTIRSVSSVAEFRSVYDDFAPHICILDYGLPDGDGMEVLRSIKKTRPEVKVLLTTALSNDSMIDDFVRAGADYFIKKPADLRNLVTSVRSAAEQVAGRGGPSGGTAAATDRAGSGCCLSPYRPDHRDFFLNAPLPLAVIDRELNVLEFNSEFVSFAEKFMHAASSISELINGDSRKKIEDLSSEPLDAKKKARFSIRAFDRMKAEYEIDLALNLCAGRPDTPATMRLAVESVRYV